MTREQAKQNLITCGIAEPSEEQITNYLNQVNGAVKIEKDRADRLKGEADKVTDLQKQLDEINSKGLSDVEKANKETEKANAQIAELQKQIKTMNNKAKLAELGITGESADKLFGETGELDFAVLGQVLSEAKANAASAKEAEIASKSGNPGEGGSGKPSELENEGAKYAQMFNAQYADNTDAGTK